MTVLAADPSEFFADALFSSGLGLWLAFFCHLMQLIIDGSSRAVQYAAHVVYSLLAAFTVFCYIVGTSYAGEPRWFILLGLAVGAAAYALAIAPAVDIVAGAFRGAARFALALIFCAYSRTLGRLFALAGRALGGLFAAIRGGLQRASKKAYNLFKKRERSKGAGAKNAKEEKEARKPVFRT